MDERILSEFWRVRDNAGRKRERLLRLAYHQSRQRKALNIAAGVLALLSAASVTALLSDLASARTMKVLAVIFSTASGLISLLVNTGYKDSEISELNAGAAGYLNLRERAQRMSLDSEMVGSKSLTALAELQESYAELDLKFQRYIVREDQRARGWFRRRFGPRRPRYRTGTGP